ncbi:KAT8 regulatory NSL complex subunit 1-like protein isoform X2 [Astyanax mexicanus]|uniref:KAT8 regulatory NSL complex subunit 1-like protein isoform X2 n=1 Tax=Astyanax mexicanus TaxID=7994 RepID=UPI0020CAFEE6|nr:KAT8 regulatory NSL complex subunit 1-like protein isoform X2 [Astyanax mexicanus]
MTAALNKSSNKVCRVEISSPNLTEHMDSDGAVLSMDAEAALKLLEENYAPWFWLNLSSQPFLDSCDSKSSVDLPEVLLSSLFAKSESFKTVLLSNEESLLEFLSTDKPGTDLSALSTASPDVDFSPAMENCQRTSPEQPDSSTDDYQGVTHFLSPQQCSGGQSRSAGCVSVPGPPAVRTQEPNHSKQNQTEAFRQIQPSSSQILQPSALRETLKTRTKVVASHHESLMARAGRAKLRLQTLLGGHAIQHCTTQLQGLDRTVYNEGPPISSCPPEPKNLNSAPVKQNEHSSPLDSSSVHQSFHSKQLSEDVQSLAQCGQAILHTVQADLDSDATASSSDEEWDPRETKATTATSECLGCEWRWQCERAELANHWTWLQIRLSELDCRIQQLRALHKNILACKGRVVLAESQPLTDRQIQQTLLTETAGLALTARNMTPDLDTEPSSPSRLLWNIERQSAHLSRMVNNLMAPLNLSPSPSSVAKGACRRWKGQQKRPFSSPLTDRFLSAGSSHFEEAGQKRRRVCRQRLFPPQVDTTCVCARTRPLLTYHKPRLFTMDQSAIERQGTVPSVLRCASCVSCDPVSECSDPACSNNAKITASRAHPMLPLSSENFLSVYLHMGLARENWLRQDHPIYSFTTAENTLHSPFRCTHRFPAARRAHTHRRESTPVRWTRTSQDTPSSTPRPNRPTPRTPRPTSRRVLKRRHHQTQTDVCLSQTGALYPSPEDSGEEAVTPNSSNTHQRNSTPQFSVRRRNAESVYNINNIVIPMSLAASTKVEKLQYKDILTPSWRIVDIVPLVEKKGEEDDEDEADMLSDETFSQRHQRYEHREKLRWSSWENGRSRTRSTMFSGSLQLCSDQSLTHSMLGSSPEFSLEERKPQLPWERRVFPLSLEEEEALRCEEGGSKSEDTLWSHRERAELSFTEFSSENSFSSFSSAAATPPAGHTEK